MTLKTHLIELTPRQVRQTMDRFLERMEEDWPDEEERHNVLLAKVGVLDRQFLRDDILPRVEGCLELDWLRANAARLAVKSSVEQFSGRGMIRVQLLDREVDKAFAWWKSN